VEKRRFERVGFHADVIIKQERLTFNGVAENISLKGLFVKTSQTLPVGEPVEISILFYGSTTQLCLCFPATVARVTEEGIGFRFDKIDLSSVLLAKNTAVFGVSHPDKVMSEFYAFLGQPVNDKY